MIVDIPYKLDLKSSLEFCNKLSLIEYDNSYMYDYKNMSMVEPFGMLLVGAKMREFKNKYSQSDHDNKNFMGAKCSYAAHMGFFKSIDQDYGKDPGQASGNSNYIPITCIDIKASYKEAFKMDLGNICYYIENKADELAGVLARGDANLKEVLKYCIVEIIRNVYDHSNSERLWYAGQYWPSKNKVEIAILDEGIGIKDSFRLNRKIKVDNDIEAIKISLLPGVTRNSSKSNIYDLYGNSGYGLYMTHNICRLGGSFTICSGERCLVIENQSYKSYNTTFKGTAIRMVLNTNLIPILSNKLEELNKGAKEIENKISQNELITNKIFQDYFNK